MGLLDGLPVNLLDLLQNSALNQNQNAGIGADAASYPMPVSLPQERAPLSLAGPGFSTGASSAPNGAPAIPDFSSSNRMPAAPLALVPPPAATAPAQPGAPGIGDRLPAGVPSWAQAPAMNPSAGFPKLPGQNLTVRTLRMKGVPEADIAAAFGNPERMQQLIYRTYRPGPASTGTQSVSSSAAVTPIGDECQPSRRCAAFRSPVPMWTRALRF
jgi:hypothetical protein